MELVSKDDVDKALARDRKEIQHRYCCDSVLFVLMCRTLCIG